ncbi:phospholipase D family protein [Methylotenera sp.]|uniref:phospholipase D family nuclease n=1 Tax=Methylotenera sp. TaxID=2051956 RepID=UPI00248943F0|nr:phospholipase D family protein [Methylotenera sp.]MDI1299775.1 phospholipase D family protein [Methylotenera sp.]
MKTTIKKTVSIICLLGAFGFSSLGFSQTIEVAFSPREGAQDLVIKVIDSSKKSLRLSAYSLTSVPVVKALIAAKKRGIDVAVVADYKQNISMDNGAGRAALNLLVLNGIQTKVISIYPIHHDKFIVADGVNVETGSFNYSKAAEYSNSENVIVVWDDAKLASQYIEHWNSRFSQANDYKPSY